MGIIDDSFRDKVKDLTLKDLIFIRKLGEGQFGHVYLVSDKTKDGLYALKAISKYQIIEQNLEKHTRVRLIPYKTKIARKNCIVDVQFPSSHKDVQDLPRRKFCILYVIFC